MHLTPTEVVALVGCVFAILYLLSLNGFFDRNDGRDRWKDPR